MTISDDRLVAFLVLLGSKCSECGGVGYYTTEGPGEGGVLSVYCSRCRGVRAKLIDLLATAFHQGEQAHRRLSGRMVADNMDDAGWAGPMVDAFLSSLSAPPNEDDLKADVRGAVRSVVEACAKELCDGCAKDWPIDPAEDERGAREHIGPVRRGFEDIPNTTGHSYEAEKLLAFAGDDEGLDRILVLSGLTGAPSKEKV